MNPRSEMNKTLRAYNLARNERTLANAGLKGLRGGMVLECPRSVVEVVSVRKGVICYDTYHDKGGKIVIGNKLPLANFMRERRFAIVGVGKATAIRRKNAR